MKNFLQPNRTLKTLFWLCVSLPALVILIYAVVLPLLQFPDTALLFNRSPEIAEALLPEQANNKEELKDLINNWFVLKADEAYLTSMLELAKSDSINLTLNLKDSTLGLIIKGVEARSCKLNHFQLSNGISYLKTSGLIPLWIERPFVLQKQWASIAKVPVQIKKAPRDTSEANKDSETFEPDKPHDVHIKLKFNRGLVLQIDQFQSHSLRSFPRKIFYWLKSSFGNLAESVSDLIHLRRLETQLWISIEISRQDAQAIYRAISHNANLTLNL